MNISESDTKPRGISVVIPNWNGAELLGTNLPYVLDVCLEYRGPTEVVVVDDCSDDCSIEVLDNGFADSVRVVRHDENKGFGTACWTGVHAARHELVLLLNSDVRPMPDLFDTMVRYFGSENTFAVSPLIKSSEGRIDNVSFRIPFLRQGRVHYRKWDWDDVLARLPRPLITLWTSGGSMLVDRTKFIELGGFDPVFAPFYREDADLGMRAWLRGWRCYVDPAATVIHPAGKSVISSKISKNRVLTVRIKNSFVFDSRYSPTHGFGAWRALLGRLTREFCRRRLKPNECFGVIKQVWDTNGSEIHRDQQGCVKTIEDVIKTFSGYYGRRSPRVFETVKGRRHRDRKKHRTDYHGVVESDLAERLNDTFIDTVVIDIGCGGRKFPGALGVDAVTGEGVNIVHNLDEFPWPIDDDSCDMVIASHIVEHVDNFPGFLEECYRILRPDGALVVRCSHFSCRDSFRHSLHLRHMCYDSIEAMLCTHTDNKLDWSYGEVPFVLGKTRITFRGGFKAHLGRFLASHNPKSWEQYWSRILPAREICWILRKPTRMQEVQRGNEGL